MSIFLPEEGKGQKAGSVRAWNFRNSDPAHFPTLMKEKKSEIEEEDKKVEVDNKEEKCGK